MNDFILHSSTLEEFQTMIGKIVEEKLQQLNQVPSPVKKDFITRQEVCQLLKISLATLHSYTKDGTLKGYRIGGRVLYRAEEVEQAVLAIQNTKYKHRRD